MTAGLVYERLNEMSKAERAFSAAARLGKQDPNIQNSYAGFLCRTGKAAAGEKLFARGGAQPAVSDAGSGAGQRRSLRAAARAMSSMPSAISSARWPFARTCPRPCCSSAIIAFDRGDAAQARDLVQRYLAVNAADVRKFCGWAFARSASSAIARRRRAMRGACRPNFPNSEQAQTMRSGIDR